MRWWAFALNLIHWVFLALGLVVLFPLAVSVPGMGPFAILLGVLWFLTGHTQLRDLALREFLHPRVVLTGLMQGLFMLTMALAVESIRKHSGVKFGEVANRLEPLLRHLPENSALNYWAQAGNEHAVWMVTLIGLACHFRLHANLARDFQKRQPAEWLWTGLHLVAGVYVGWLVAAIVTASGGTVMPLLQWGMTPATQLDVLGRSEILYRFLAIVAVSLSVLLIEPKTARWLTGLLRQNTIGMLFLGLCVFVGLIELVDAGRRSTNGWINWLTLAVIIALVGKLRQSRADQVDDPSPDATFETPTIAQAVQDPKTGPYSNGILIFAIEGGGIHAYARALFVLSELYLKTGGDFWKKTLIVSSVSGGSVGTAAFGALQRALGNQPERLRCACHQVARGDLLTLALFRLFFTEPLNLIWPSRNFDRSRGLELCLQEAVSLAERRSANDWVETTRPVTDWQPTAKAEWEIGKSVADAPPGQPFAGYNTTSILYGDRFLMSPLLLRRVRTLGNQRKVHDGTQHVSHLSAACLSARFPVITGPGMIRMRCETADHVIDGGIFDNTGLYTCLDVIRDIGAGVVEGNSPKIMLVVIGNNADPDKIGAQSAEPTERGSTSQEASETVALVRAAASTLQNQNREGSRRVNDLNPKNVQVVVFKHDFEPFQIPLGWFLARSRVDALAYMMGLDTVWTRPKNVLTLGFKPRMELRTRQKSKSVVTTQLDEMFCGSSLSDDQKARALEIRHHNKHAMRRVVTFCQQAQPLPPPSPPTSNGDGGSA
jgi:hypothetical protein